MDQHEIDADREEAMRQERISERADHFLGTALARGEPFSEGLCDWAWNKAERGE